MEGGTTLKDLIVESDILVDFLKGVEGARDALVKAVDEGVVRVSAVSVVEVMAESRGDRQEVTGELLDSFGILPVEREVALLAGRFCSDGARDKPGLCDCIVAGTAQQLGAVLVTKGRRKYPAGDFEKRVVTY